MDDNDVLRNLKKQMKAESKRANSKHNCSSRKSSRPVKSQGKKQKRHKGKSRAGTYSKTSTYALIGPSKTTPNNASTKGVSDISARDSKDLEINDFLAEIEPPNRDGIEKHLRQSQSQQNIRFSEPVVNNGEEIDIYIGLDFGTAFTKVVIGEVVYKYILEFSTGDTLLPSRVWIDDNGECRLQKFGNARAYDDLKMPILNGTTTDADKTLIIAFLALVFAECHRWFANSPYQKHKPEWFINCGLPTESTGNQEVSSIYSELIYAAWILSHCDVISVPNAARIHNSVGKYQNFPLHVLVDQEEQINLYPEFIAQLSGYINSPSRRPYSHLLIDIGAGTIDVSAFCIDFEDYMPVYKVVAEEVRNLGVKVLNRYRLKIADAPLTSLQNILEKPDNEIASALGLTEKRLNEMDKPFVDCVNRLVARIIREIKSGALNFASATIMICGGGKSVPLYRKALEPVDRDFKTEYADIARIDNLSGQANALTQYHRFSVAAGLCIHPDNLAEMERKKIEKIYNNQRSEEKEQLIERNRREFYKT